MLNHNNAAVGLTTRALLQEWRTSGLIDEAASGLMTRALKKSRTGGPGGWVFLLAETLGSVRQCAFLAGSCAELFHAAVDLIDDIQDGDTPSWFSDVLPPLQLNTAFHLVAASTMVAARIEKGLAGAIHASFCRMLTGQGREISRDPWTFRAYLDVSHRIAGQQIAVYLHTACSAAQRDPEPLLSMAEPLGLLMMIQRDLASEDERLVCFDAETIDQARSQTIVLLRQDREKVPEAARPVIDAWLAMAMEPCPKNQVPFPTAPSK